MFPDVEGQDGIEAVGNRVVGAGALQDGEGAVVSSAEPYPAAAEETDSSGFKFGLEDIQGAPLLRNLCSECSGRFVSSLVSRCELGEVHIVVEHLTGIVEQSAGGCAAHNLFQGHILKPAAGQQLVEVIHIGRQVLAVVETERLGADDRFQGIGRVW